MSVRARDVGEAVAVIAADLLNTRAKQSVSADGADARGAPTHILRELVGVPEDLERGDFVAVGACEVKRTARAREGERFESNLARKFATTERERQKRTCGRAACARPA